MTEVPSFDADTALTPVGTGRWRAPVPAHWLIVNGANGGLLAAHATRALQLAVDDPERAPRSLTLHYLHAPGAGELEYEVRIERAGRATTFASLRVTRGDVVIALGLGVLGVWREGEVDWAPPAPVGDVPAAADVEPVAPLNGSPAFSSNYDMRWVLGDAPRSGSEEALAGGWIRTAQPRALDHVALAAYADAWWPAAFPRLRKPAFLPTLDLTIHWRAPLPADAAAHPFVLARFWSEQARGGMFEENGELWAADGTLLVQSRQLALLRYART